MSRSPEDTQAQEIDDRMRIELYYNRKSKDYDTDMSVSGTLYSEVYDTITWQCLKRYLPKSPGSLVLDAAGGTGKWAILMAKEGCHVVLLDASEGMLDVARRKIRRENLEDSVTIRKGDIANLEFPDDMFDLVLCERTLFLLSDPSTVVRELTRVLKNGSPLIASASNRYIAALTYLPDDLDRAYNTVTGKDDLFLETESAPRLKVHHLSPNEFKELLEKEGLRIERITGKVFTLPLRFPHTVYFGGAFEQNLRDRILRIELSLCDKPDALGLAAHLQAIAYKL